MHNGPDSGGLTEPGNRRTNDPRTVTTYSVRRSVQLLVSDMAADAGVSRSSLVDAILGFVLDDLAVGGLPVIGRYPGPVGDYLAGLHRKINDALPTDREMSDYYGTELP